MCSDFVLRRKAWGLLQMALVGMLGSVLVPGTGYSADIPASVSAENHLITSPPSPQEAMNVATFLGADRFYEQGIFGQNTSVANVEAGYIWNGHEALTHVSHFYAGTGAAGEFDRHATKVGMMIGGRQGGASPGEKQTGIAPDTDLQSGAVATSWVEPAYATSFNATTSSIYSTYSHFFGDVDIINSSWGFTDRTGTDPITMNLDTYALVYPLTSFVAAAGNYGAANTVTGPASGFNAISVGALTGANGYEQVASFSSRGPQDYGDPNGTVSGVRAPVDIVAPGASLVSAYYGGQTGGNGDELSGSPSGAPGDSDSYQSYLAGTSYAAPIVAGSVALLDSAARVEGLVDAARDSRVIKTVLLNSADKLAGWDNGQYDNAGVVTTTQSLDWAMGAGRLNLDCAYDQYLAGTTDLPGLSGGSIETTGWDFGKVGDSEGEYVGDVQDYVFDTQLVEGSKLGVTLNWFRSFNQQLADLDVQIWDSTFSTLYGSSQSDYNNVEHLFFEVPEDGEYAMRVIFDEQTYGIATPHEYAVAWWAALAGDANLDDFVDGSDLNFLLSAYDTKGAWSTGDFDGDGLVDGVDLNMLLGTYGTGAMTASTALLEATGYETPEPSTLAMLVAGGFGLLLVNVRRTRRRRRTITGS